MTKPVHGDELTIRYNGGLTRARCTEVMEIPARGAGAARFTIISPTVFQRGTEAALVKGAAEVTVQVVQVIAISQRHMNIVAFNGVFGQEPA